MTYPTRAAVFEVLDYCGPLTAAEVSEFFPGALPINVSNVLSELRRAKTKRVYIKAWTHDAPNGKAYPRPVYALGSKPDAKRPKPEAKTAIAKRYRERQKVRAGVVGGPTSVFDLARFL